MTVLNGLRILIVEDDFLVADDLARHFEIAGATVLGPEPSIARSERYIDCADAAVLDIDLGGELVFPLADRLHARDIPLVFYSGCNIDELPHRFHNASLLRKPEQVLRAFARHFDRGAQAHDEDVELILPKLRVIARTICLDPEAADRLVERTLQKAIDGAVLRHPHHTTGQWLVEILSKVAGTRKRSFMN